MKVIQDINEDDIELDKLSDSNVLSEVPTRFGSSDVDILRMDVGGIIGLLERIPAWLKLTFLILLALMIMVVLSAILFAIQGKEIKTAIRSRSLINNALLIDGLVSSMQKERKEVMSFMSFENYTFTEVAEYEPLSSAVQATDRGMKKVGKILDSYTDNYYGASTVWDELMHRYNDTVEITNTLRLSLDDHPDMSVTTNRDVYFETYVGSISTLLDIVAFLVEKSDIQSVSAYTDFGRMNECYQQASTFVYAIVLYGKFTDKNSKSLITYTGRRDYTINIWKPKVDSEISAKYNNAINPEIVIKTKLIEETLQKITRSGGSTTLTSDISEVVWNNYTALIYGGLSVVGDQIRQKLEDSNQKSVASSSSYVIIIVVFCAFAFVVFTFSGIAVFRTIVGPWRRLNLMQKFSMDNFVPDVLLKLMGCENIGEVVLGKYKRVRITIMTVEIKDFNKNTLGMKAETRLAYINSILERFCGLVKPHGGFVHKCNSTGFVAIFSRSFQGLNSAMAINDTVDEFNDQLSPSLPKISVCIGLHTGMVLIAVIGAQGKIEIDTIGPHMSNSDTMSKISTVAGPGIFATDSASSKCGTNTRQFKRMYIGTIKQQRETEKELETEKIYKILDDVGNLLTAHIESFEGAVTSYERGLFESSVKQFASLIDNNTDDKIIKYYMESGSNLSNAFRGAISKLGLREVLKEKSMYNAMHARCAKEQSVENIDLWAEIQAFKSEPNPIQRKIHLTELWKVYIEANSAKMVNINDTMRDHVGQLSTSPAYPNNDDLDAIEREIETLMSKDTYMRFKKSEECMVAFSKSSLGQPKRWLNGIASEL